MVDITFWEVKEKGCIVVKRADYDSATGVLFKFTETRAGFQVPDDVTIDEMAEALERVSNALRKRESVLFMPSRYVKERAEEIRKIQEEEKEK